LLKNAKESKDKYKQKAKINYIHLQNMHID
jgi:hypothetical protein